MGGAYYLYCSQTPGGDVAIWIYNNNRNLSVQKTKAASDDITGRWTVPAPKRTSGQIFFHIYIFTINMEDQSRFKLPQVT